MQLLLFGLLACTSSEFRVPAAGLDAMENPVFAVDHFGTDADATANLHVKDIDGDGRWEVLAANGEHGLGVNQLYSTGGDGVLQASSRLSERFESTFDVALVLLDDDELYDVVEINDHGTPSRICYAERCDTYGESWHSRDVAVQDFDGDGLLDVVILNKLAQDAIIWGHSPGSWELFGPVDAGDTSAITVDVNGDSWPDLIISARDGERPRIHLGGRAGFDEGTTLPIDNDTRAITARDYQHDGDLDLFFAVLDGPNVLLVNDGDGGFDRVIEVCRHNHMTWAIAVGDLDEDGRLDVVEGNIGAPDNVHYGLGGGEFTNDRPFGDRENTKAIRVVDVDRDGDLDIVAGHYFTKNDVLLNQVLP